MTKIIMRKRKPLSLNEVGFFVDDEVFAEDFAVIKMDAEVEVDAKTKRSLKQLRFAWRLATIIADSCDWLDDKESAMDYILIEARHAKFIYDPLRQISYARPKPTNFGAMDGVAYTKLLKRMVNVVATHIVPGIDREELRREIEAMINPDLIPSGPDLGPEPPPPDTIPDGPGTGHNSRRAGVEPIQPETKRTGPPRASAAEAGSKPPPKPEATPEPPQP